MMALVDNKMSTENVDSEFEDPKQIKAQAQRAVHALLEYAQRTKNEKTDFLGDSLPISLQVCFKKAPSSRCIIKVPLPESPTNDTYSVCMFVKDITSKTERDFSQTVDHFKEKLEKCGMVNVPQIVPMKCLKTEMKPYEAKRKLSNQFDKFLADERIVGMLPGILGKHFYSKGKNPLQVKLHSKDLRQEVEQAINSSLFIVNGRGSNSQVQIGHVNMSEDNLIRNLICAIETVMKMVPGGPQNIRLLTVRTTDSVAIPVYLSLGKSSSVELPEDNLKMELDEPEDLGTGLENKVRVLADSRIQVIDAGDTGFEEKYKIEASEEAVTRKVVNTRWQKNAKRKYTGSRISTGKPKKAKIRVKQ